VALHETRANGSRAAAVGLPILFALVATLYSLIVPVWEAPDEPAHFAYVTALLDERALPVMDGAGPTEAHQPPLYYLLAAALAAPVDRADPSGAFEPNPRFIWAAQGGREPNVAVHGTAGTFPFAGQALALHLARLSSVLAGAATVGLVVLLTLELFPARVSIALLAGGLAAFNPQFVFAGGVLSNDSLTALTCTATALATLRATRAPDHARGWLLAGLAIALALMTKMTAAFLLPAVLLAVLAMAVQRRSTWTLIRGATSVLAPVAGLCGWWFARNQLIYGDPFGHAVFREIHAWNQRFAPVGVDDLQRFADKTFRSFWGTFGWMTIQLPDWAYAVALVLSILGCLWFLPAAALSWRGAMSRRQQAGLAWLSVFAIGQGLVVGSIALECGESCYQGRYLFGAIAAIALLMAFALLSLVPERAAVPLAGTAVALLCANSLWVLNRDIRPAYELPALTKSEARAAPTNVEVTIGEDFRLLGYDLTDRREGGSVRVTLYWRALGRPAVDYSAFVHLIDRDGAILAQKDQPPGAPSGHRPTAWTSGDVVSDPHEVVVRPDVGAYRLRIGLYDSATGQQLPVTRGGQAEGTYLVLAPPMPADARAAGRVLPRS
jgi:4-amino-4-deoxy-L-arabinose transferase-like glycosyltransferase